MVPDKRKTVIEITKSRPAKEIKDLLIKIEQLRRDNEIEKLNCQKREDKIKVINQELIQERASKSNWLITEKQLFERLKQLEQELTHLNQTREAEKVNSQKHQETMNNKDKQLSNRVKQLEQEIEVLKNNRVTEKLNIQKRQETINILNHEIAQEKTRKDQWLIKERELNDRVKQMEQEITLSNLKTTAVQTKLEDKRKENEKLYSKIETYSQSERELTKTKETYETNETYLNELVKKLTGQRKELSQANNKLKQDAASDRTTCKSLQAQNLKLHEQHDKLQTELESLKKERIMKTSALLDRERKERRAIQEQLTTVTLQLEQGTKELKAGIIYTYNI